MNFLDKEQLNYIEGEIKPIYITNAVAWTLSNCSIESVDDIPNIFGGMATNPVQQVFAQEIIKVLKLDKGE